MRCMYCAKKIGTKSDGGWHKTCIKRFFNTDTLPICEIDEKLLDSIADKNIAAGYTVTGVQKKLSLGFNLNDNKHRLTIVDYPPSYILKPQVKEFECLPEAEHLVMQMASLVGITTVPNAIIKSNIGYAYIVKRIDRLFLDNGIKKFAMEDFCQLDLRLTQDKYKGSYERCAKIVAAYSSRKGFDLTELYIRLVFSFIIGNSDMHLKNLSLIETEPGSRQYILTPAYDLLPVNIVMPEDKEQFALTLNGKKTRLRRKDFIIFSKSCGISEKVGENLIDSLISQDKKLISICKESLLPADMQNSLISLMTTRMADLQK